MPRYWVGLDQGSGATKSCLIDRRGRIRRLVTVPVSTRYPAPERAEQDGEALFRSARNALGRLLRGIDPAAIGGLGITSQRSTFLLWDPDTGRPLTPAISWRDRRAENLCRSLSRLEKTIIRKTGLRLSPHYAASKIRWLLDRSPALRSRAERGTARIGTLDSYLLHRFTRGSSWSTDPTHAARTLLMDLERLEWDPMLLELFRVPIRALPSIRPSAFPAGEIRIGRVPLPVAATLGDQQAALIGLGCRHEGELAVNYGTGAFVVLNTGRRLRRVDGLLSSVAWSAHGEVRYLLEGTINAAGSALEWLTGLSGGRRMSHRRADDLDRLPVVIPSFSGLGAPHWVASARGAILDLDLRTDREALLRGALAGVGCRVREILETLDAKGQRPRRIVAGGGLARWPLLLPLQATLLGRPISRARTPEGTARGAALLAGHALGHWDLDSDPRLATPERTIRPSFRSPSVLRYYRRFREGVAEVARRGSS